jgi:hypothetical protein
VIGILLTRLFDDTFDHTDKEFSRNVHTADDYEEWEILGEFKNEVQAQIVADWLESEEIPAISETESPTITEGASFLLNQRVRVPKKYIQKASKLLEETDFESHLKKDS